MATAPALDGHPPPEAPGERPRAIARVVPGPPRLRGHARVRRGRRAHGHRHDPPQRRARPRHPPRPRPRPGPPPASTTSPSASPAGRPSRPSPPRSPSAATTTTASTAHRSGGCCSACRTPTATPSASTPCRSSCPTRRSSSAYRGGEPCTPLTHGGRSHGHDGFEGDQPNVRHDDETTVDRCPVGRTAAVQVACGSWRPWRRRSQRRPPPAQPPRRSAITILVARRHVAHRVGLPNRRRGDPQPRGDFSEWTEEFRTPPPFEGETVLVLEIGERVGPLRRVQRWRSRRDRLRRLLRGRW